MAKRAATKQEKAARAKPAPLVSLEQSPARTVVLRRVADLKENPRNVRTHPVAQLAVLDESFSDHGQVKPLVINAEGVLLAGHGSRDALMHLYGPDAEVACVILAQDDTLQRKFMVRDNAGADLSGWDTPRLGLELADLKSLGVPDLAALGFRPAMLTKILPAPPREGTADLRAEAPPALGPVSRPGDVWLLGNHRLVCGDDMLDHADNLVRAWEDLTKKRALFAAGGLTMETVATARKTEKALALRMAEALAAAPAARSAEAKAA